MTQQQIADCTQQRLTSWGKIAIRSHATPLLMVCAGHDDERGNVALLVPEGITTREILHILKGAIARIERGEALNGADEPQGV